MADKETIDEIREAIEACAMVVECHSEDWDPSMEDIAWEIRQLKDKIK